MTAKLASPTSSMERICRTGCCSPPIFHGASSQRRAARARRSAISDRTGAIWFSTSSGGRIEAVLADLSTVVATRFKPAKNREAFASADERGEEFRVQSEDLATVLVRFEGGAKGSVCVGQVCAGHKNDLWFEVNGRTASAAVAAGKAERAVDRPARRGKRHAAEGSGIASRGGAAVRAPAGRASGSLGGCVLQRHERYLRLHRQRPKRRRSEATCVCHVRGRLSCRMRG